MPTVQETGNPVIVQADELLSHSQALTFFRYAVPGSNAQKDIVAQFNWNNIAGYVRVVEPNEFGADATQIR